MLDIASADCTIVRESPGTVNASAHGRGYVFFWLCHPSRLTSNPMSSNYNSRSLGHAGETQLSSILELFDWGPVSTGKHDSGTDLFVQVREPDLFDGEAVLGVQVKTGASYFREQSKKNGDISGWWYSENPPRHFDYWTKHVVPHVLVLCDPCDPEDPRTWKFFWVYVTSEEVKSAGKGRKILVPANQVIDKEHRRRLAAVAYDQKHSPVLEGTAFEAAAKNMAPSQQLRYALIAPRLVAPHRNAGYGTPIGAVEGIALLVQGRFDDVDEFAKQHAEVPHPKDEPTEGEDWTWSFAAAIWNWAETDSVDRLRAVYQSAPGGTEKAASGVFLACTLRRFHVQGEATGPRDGHGEATAVLDELVKGADLDPADLGWVLVQRACTTLDVGNDDDVRSDASAALRNFVDGSDVTVTALAAAAIGMVWSMDASSNFAEADLSRLLTTSDNAVAWWQSQTVSTALSAAATAQFRSWTDKRSFLYHQGNTSATGLFSAELNADLLGDHGTWRHLSSLRARYRLVSAADSRDEVGELVEGLDALRRSGDCSSLESSITHLRRVGPTEAIVKFVNRIPSGGWTSTEAPANFDALRKAGDLMDQASATDLLIWIPRIMGGDTTVDDERILQTVIAEHAVFGAAEGLMSSADGRAHQAVAEMIAALPHAVFDDWSSCLPFVIIQLEFDHVAVSERTALCELGYRDHGRSGTAALRWLVANHDTEALVELKHRARNGETAVLSAIPASALDEAEARPIIDRLADVVRDKVSSPQKGSFEFGGSDNSGVLTSLNLWFPGVARWEPVIELLFESRAYERDKRYACTRIINESERVPSRISERLASNIDAIGNAAGVVGVVSGASIATATGIAIGALSGDEADTAIARLASGSSQERQDAALLLGSGHRPNMQPALAALAADARFEVRHVTAEAVGKLAAANPSPQIEGLARRIAGGEGTDLSRTLLAGLFRQDQQMSELGLEIARQLAQSPSARVRHRAHRLLKRHGEA